MPCWSRRSEVNGQTLSSWWESNRDSDILITTRVCRWASLTSQHIKPWSRWAPPVEGHSFLYLDTLVSYKKRRLQVTQAQQNWTTDDWKHCLVCWVLIFATKFKPVVWHNEHGSVLSCLKGCWWWCNGVGIFSWHVAKLKAQIISNELVEKDHELTLLKCTPQSSDFNTIEVASKCIFRLCLQCKSDDH